jgi:putative oxygen-independent coproporphyrinogen III oxidase
MTHLPPFDAGFGVYVHWPFCASKCPYCDFNSHVRYAPIDEARYVAAFAREIEHQAKLVPGRIVGSIFFGGGTPSLMKPETIGTILNLIARHWSIAPDVEITMEANPTSIEASRLRGYRDTGVNRLSMGFQAMNDADLRALGRLHSVAEARAAVKTASHIFDHYSFDLIYARPGQTPDAWAHELKEAIALSAEHLSLYQLTIEPGTMFERRVAAGQLKPMPDDEARVLFDVTREVCDVAGMPAYEISNHARKGAECRHNLLYWNYGEYAGIGPGAHARLFTDKGRIALSTLLHPETWLEAVEKNGHGTREIETLSASDQANEFLLMGLRLAKGIKPERFLALAGQSLPQNPIDELTADGFLETSETGVLRVTAKGVPVLNTIIEQLSI